MDIPYLEDNCEESCPVGKDEILEYLSLEEGGEANVLGLTFFRTARIGKTALWLWQYTSEYADEAYAIVHSRGKERCIGSWARDEGQTVEDMMKEYHDTNCR